MCNLLNINFNEEIWKDVIGWEGLYKVSNFGRVKSLSRYVRSKSNSLKPIPELILSPDITSRYARVLLCNGSDIFGKKIFKKESVHRLVGKAFIENPNNYPVINHLNCNCFDNRVDNLEWTTIQANTKHAYDNGLLKDLKKYHFKKGNKPQTRNKIVINTQTGIYYESVIIAAESSNYSIHALYAMLSNKKTKGVMRINNSSFLYA